MSVPKALEVHWMQLIIIIILFVVYVVAFCFKLTKAFATELYFLHNIFSLSPEGKLFVSSLIHLFEDSNSVIMQS